MLTHSMQKKIFYSFLGLLCSISSLKSEEIDLHFYEKKLISQNGEDGILEKIFNLIGTTSKYYVDFGAGDGHFWSNSKYLREKYGWIGLLLEAGSPPNLDINLRQEIVTAENICDLFEKYNVPHEFDLISIDIDGNDFYVWNALSSKYKPRVVAIEFNSRFKPNEDRVVKYSGNVMWNGQSVYYGASMLAFYNLGRKLGYSLIYQESQGINLFFIRDDVLEKSGIKFKNANDVSKLCTVIREMPDEIKELFISSQEALQSN